MILYQFYLILLVVEKIHKQTRYKTDKDFSNLKNWKKESKRKTGVDRVIVARLQVTWCAKMAL
jgi:hypothetical protein